MVQRKGGLGRGLDALIQSQTDAVDGGIQEVEVDAISPNPFQPRGSLSSQEIEALAASMREHGVIQPLIVTPSPEETPFRLVVGERRWRAAQMVGLRSVPAIVREASPRTMLEIALIENVQRADLSVLEEAGAYRQLIADFGLTQAEVAERVGKSRAAIANALRIPEAPEEIKSAISARAITEGHARALLGLPLAAEQVAALQIVVGKDFNVRQTEQLVREWRIGAEPKRRDRTVMAPTFQRLEEGFRRALGTKVELRRGRKGGQIVIHYYSDEELDGLYRRFVDVEEHDL